MKPAESVTWYGPEPATNDFPRAGEMREWEWRPPPIFPCSPSPPELTVAESVMIGYQVPDMNQSAAIGEVKLALLLILEAIIVSSEGWNNSSSQGIQISCQGRSCPVSDEMNYAERSLLCFEIQRRGDHGLHQETSHFTPDSCFLNLKPAPSSASK